MLLDGGFITQEIWDSYYKFIIVRNPYARALSDYLWVMKDLKINDSFSNFLNMSGAFKMMKDTSDLRKYRADHLLKQRDYFFLNNKQIDYDCVIRFESISKGLQTLISHLELDPSFFEKKKNVSGKKYKHYSHFYTKERKALIDSKYGDDLQFFGYHFENKKQLVSRLLYFFSK